MLATVNNLLANTAFLRNKEGRRNGAPIENVSITVKFVESPPESYSREELENLFAVSSDDDKMLWRFLLGTGFREAEAAVAEYDDVNPGRKTITVVEKPQFNFKPKDCEKRIIPISDDLIAQLKARKNGSSLIFGKTASQTVTFCVGSSGTTPITSCIGSERTSPRIATRQGRPHGRFKSGSVTVRWRRP